jgi:hypothetical protein
MPQALLLLLVQSLFANTFFFSVVYHPDESQLVTAGTDRKVRHHARRAEACRRAYCISCIQRCNW